MKYFAFILLNFIIFGNVVKNNNITLKIKGSGKQRFINTNAEKYHAHCPNETSYINGTTIGNNLCEAYLEKEENIIILKWNI